jgi:hypothetical protein
VPLDVQRKEKNRMITAVHTRLLCALTLAIASSACYGPRLRAADAPASLSSGEQAAVEAAKQALGAQAGDYTVQAVEPRQWPDSSLGCPRPGMMYLQVITDGYVVLLEGAGKLHEVHVASDVAVVCPDRMPSAAPRQPVRAPVRVTNLPAMESQAIADLAQRLSVATATIQIIDRSAQQWSEAAFQCRPGADSQAGGAPVIRGFKLVLRHQGRTYLYHTDLQRVLPCPPIERQ